MIGKIISHYKILQMLGRGGMGAVYLAQDLSLSRKVAIKFLIPELTKNNDNIERFKREARAAASLNHINIITIFEIAEEDDRTFIVMEFIDGKSLRQIIEEHVLTLDKIYDIVCQICAGLSQAHMAGIVHRDIKPENIMLDKHDCVKILDFGIVKLKGERRLTKDSSTLGTAYYMSPEQLKSAEIDQRSDIWSLGIVFYELLTGRVPFDAEYDHALYYAIQNEEPKSLRIYRKDLPVGLEQVLFKCLNKSAEDRYENTNTFMDELLPLTGEQSRGQMKILSRRPFRKRKSKSHISIVSVLFIFLIIVSLIIAYTIFQNSSAPDVNIKDQKTFFHDESIGIWSVDVDSSIPIEIKLAFQNKITEAVIESGAYEVIEKNLLVNLFKAKDVTIAEESDIFANKERSPVSRIFSTSILNVSPDVYSIDMKIINIENGKTESALSKNVSGTMSKILGMDVPAMVYKLIGKKVIKIEVSESGIICDKNIIAYLDPQLAKHPDIIIEELQTYLDRVESSVDSLKQAGVINFVEVILKADRRLKYGLFFRLMYTISQSGFINIRLVDTNQPEMIAPVSIPQTRNQPDRNSQLGLVIGILQDGFLLSANEKFVTDSTSPEFQLVSMKVDNDSLNGNYDFEGLNRALYDLKKDIMDSPVDIDRAIILANKNIDFEMILQTANATRVRVLENGQEYLLFPAITFGQIANDPDEK